MFQKLIAGVAVVVLTAGAGLVATTGAAEAKSPRPTLAVPKTVKAGQHFAVTVMPHRKGTVLLQRKADKGPWKTVAHRKSRHASGKILFHRVERTSGRVAYRTKVAGHVSKVDRMTITEATNQPGGSGTVTPPPAAPSLFVDVSTNADDIFVNTSYTVGVAAAEGDGAPIAGLQIKVERQNPGASTWIAAGTYTTDSAGEASFTDSSATRGIISYRATSSDGKLSGQTEAVVWQNLTMPAAAGNGLAVATHTNTAAGCTAGIAAGSNGVDLKLNSKAATPAQTMPPKPADPGCKVAVGDSVTLTWTFGGNGCVPVQYDDFSFDGPASSQVTLGIEIDGADLSPDPATFAVSQHAPKLSVDGDPMQQLVVTMTVANAGTGAGAGASITGHLVGAQAMCF